VCAWQVVFHNGEKTRTYVVDAVTAVDAIGVAASRLDPGELECVTSVYVSAVDDA
jgi:hypothetical protein